MRFIVSEMPIVDKPDKYFEVVVPVQDISSGQRHNMSWLSCQLENDDFGARYMFIFLNVINSTK